MTVKHVLLPVILSPFIFFSCKKSNNTPVATPPAATALIDSMVGYYYGVTSGDSIYTYIDSTGKQQQWVHSFSWLDTLVVTSADSASITTASKYYNITFPYGDSLSVYGDSLGLVNNIVTNLQVVSAIQNGYANFQANFCDTSLELNHITINILYGYSKHLTSNFVLYSRQ